MPDLFGVESRVQPVRAAVVSGAVGAVAADDARRSARRSAGAAGTVAAAASTGRPAPPRRCFCGAAAQRAVAMATPRSGRSPAPNDRNATNAIASSPARLSGGRLPWRRGDRPTQRKPGADPAARPPLQGLVTPAASFALDCRVSFCIQRHPWAQQRRLRLLHPCCSARSHLPADVADVKAWSATRCPRTLGLRSDGGVTRVSSPTVRNLLPARCRTLIVADEMSAAE